MNLYLPTSYSSLQLMKTLYNQQINLITNCNLIVEKHQTNKQLNISVNLYQSTILQFIKFQYNERGGNQSKLTTEQYLDELAKMTSSIQNDMKALLTAQQISNFLALANNQMVSEEIRTDALNRAMTLMGIKPQELTYPKGFSKLV